MISMKAIKTNMAETISHSHFLEDMPPLPGGDEVNGNVEIVTPEQEQLRSLIDGLDGQRSAWTENGLESEEANHRLDKEVASIVNTVLSNPNSNPEDVAETAELAVATVALSDEQPEVATGLNMGLKTGGVARKSITDKMALLNHREVEQVAEEIDEAERRATNADMEVDNTPLEKQEMVDILNAFKSLPDFQRTAIPLTRIIDFMTRHTYRSDPVSPNKTIEDFLNDKQADIVHECMWSGVEDHGGLIDLPDDDKWHRFQMTTKYDRDEDRDILKSRAIYNEVMRHPGLARGVASKKEDQYTTQEELFVSRIGGDVYVRRQGDSDFEFRLSTSGVDLEDKYDDIEIQMDIQTVGQIDDLAGDQEKRTIQDIAARFEWDHDAGMPVLQPEYVSKMGESEFASDVAELQRAIQERIESNRYPWTMPNADRIPSRVMETMKELHEIMISRKGYDRSSIHADEVRVSGVFDLAGVSIDIDVKPIFDNYYSRKQLMDSGLYFVNTVGEAEQKILDCTIENADGVMVDFGKRALLSEDELKTIYEYQQEHGYGIDGADPDDVVMDMIVADRIRTGRDHNLELGTVERIHKYGATSSPFLEMEGQALPGTFGGIVKLNGISHRLTSVQAVLINGDPRYPGLSEMPSSRTMHDQRYLTAGDYVKYIYIPPPTEEEAFSAIKQGGFTSRELGWTGGR